MSNLKIEVIINQEKDLETIGKFFFKKETDNFKKRILNFYPSLKTLLETTQENPETIVRNYFQKIYSKNNQKIERIFEESKNIINDRGNICLEALVSLMGYKSEKKEVFIATPTLLPFSPFERPIFYYSIAPIIFNDTPNHILDIAIHEISHFLFFDILDNLKINLREDNDDRNLLHLFKESLTAMLLSEKELTTLLENKNYKGNQEIQYLNMLTLEKEIMNITEYLRNNFHEYCNKNLSFSVFIEDMINILSPKKKEFSDKKIFWNKNEQEIKRGNKTLLEKYSEPIKLQK